MKVAAHPCPLDVELRRRDDVPDSDDDLPDLEDTPQSEVEPPVLNVVQLPPPDLPVEDNGVRGIMCMIVRSQAQHAVAAIVGEGGYRPPFIDPVEIQVTGFKEPPWYVGTDVALAWSNILGYQQVRNGDEDEVVGAGDGDGAEVDMGTPMTQDPSRMPTGTRSDPLVLDTPPRVQSSGSKRRRT